MKRSGLNNLKELYSDDEKTIFDLRDTPFYIRLNPYILKK